MPVPTRVPSTCPSSFTFLATGGDSFSAFTEGEMLDTGLLDLDLFRAYLADNPGLSPDYARQQVFVQGMPDEIKAGDQVEFQAGVGATEAAVLPVNPKTLDLTSLGSPANTEVQITAIDGEARIDLGSVPVTDGIADVSFTVPAELRDGGSIELVAQPSGTTMVLEVTPAPKAASAMVVKTRPDRVVVDRTRPRVVVKVTTAGSPASGEVKVRAGGETHMVELNRKGKARVKLEPFRTTGRKNVKVVYLGDDATKRSRTVAMIRVVQK